MRIYQLYLPCLENISKLKMIFNSDLRKCKITNLTVPAIRQKVATTFNIDYKMFVIKYKDEDDDEVTLDTQETLEDAASVADSTVLRLYIYSVDTPVHLPDDPNVNTNTTTGTNSSGNATPTTTSSANNISTTFDNSGSTTTSNISKPGSASLQKKNAQLEDELANLKNQLRMQQEENSRLNEENNRVVPKALEINFQDLTFISKVGEGSFGFVWKGKLYGQDVAIKQLKLKASDQQTKNKVLKDFRSEVSYLKSLRNPNIVLFMGASTDPEHLCIVTEFLAGGSLYEVVQNRRLVLNNWNVCHIARDIAGGLNYLHKQTPPIIHRDVKSHNLLLDANGICKVADFGLARFKSGAEMTKFRGTATCMARELMNVSSQYDQSVDVFSFGVILWEMITRCYPWSRGSCDTCLTVATIIRHVSMKKTHLPVPADVYPPLASLIQRCWDYDQSNRPSFDVILTELDKMISVLTEDPFLAHSGHAFKVDQTLASATELHPGTLIGEFSLNGPVVSSASSISIDEKQDWEALPDMPCPYLPEVILNEQKARKNGTSNAKPQEKKNYSEMALTTAKEFWKENPSISEKTSVPIAEFLTVFLQKYVTNLKTEPSILENFRFTPRDMFFLAWLLDSSKKATGFGTVTIQSFCYFVRAWAEFGSPLLNAMATFQCPYFHGFLPWGETRRILAAAPVGSFLVRMSQSNPEYVGVASHKEISARRHEVTQLKVKLQDVRPSWDQFIQNYSHYLKYHVPFQLPKLGPHFQEMAENANKIVASVKGSLTTKS